MDKFKLAQTASRAQCNTLLIKYNKQVINEIISYKQHLNILIGAYENAHRRVTKTISAQDDFVRNNVFIASSIVTVLGGGVLSFASTGLQSMLAASTAKTMKTKAAQATIHSRWAAIFPVRGTKRLAAPKASHFFTRDTAINVIEDGFQSAWSEMLDFAPAWDSIWGLGPIKVNDLKSAYARTRSSLAKSRSSRSPRPVQLMGGNTIDVRTALTNHGLAVDKLVNKVFIALAGQVADPGLLPGFDVLLEVRLKKVKQELKAFLATTRPKTADWENELEMTLWVAYLLQDYASQSDKRAKIATTAERKKAALKAMKRGVAPAAPFGNPGDLPVYRTGYVIEKRLLELAKRLKVDSIKKVKNMGYWLGLPGSSGLPGFDPNPAELNAWAASYKGSTLLQRAQLTCQARMTKFVSAMKAPIKMPIEQIIQGMVQKGYISKEDAAKIKVRTAKAG